MKLHLGCGHTHLDGFVNIDITPMPGVDLALDLDNGCRLPFPGNSVGDIFGYHVLEHIKDRLGLMQELHRVARPGARAVFSVPYGGNDSADEDPTHVCRMYPNSWGFFSQPFYWRADYGYRADWKIERVIIVARADRIRGLTSEQAYEKIRELRNVGIEMTAHLIAVKPIRPARRELQDPMIMEIRGMED